MYKKWQIAEKINDDFKNLFPEIGEIILQLLYNRNIDSPEKIDKFLNTDYMKDLHDPFLFLDMDKAVERILKAMRNNEKIAIFGDYDADGVTSTVILKKFLDELSNTSYKLKSGVDVYIPHRGKEGYGLNKKALKYLKENGNNLIVTVDCGISNFEEVNYGNSLGLDIIITDHHYPPQKLPNAYAVINPKVLSDKYPFRELAGVGVAFKLAQALIKRISIESSLKESDYWEGVEKWLLDLVAIGTIADCCPLVDENRIFVKYGLFVLNKTKNLGLKALLEFTSIAKKQNNSVIYSNTDYRGNTLSEIDTWAIGFQIAPRINSAGRLDHANTSYKLLITQDKNEAKSIANTLNETNNRRQALTEQGVKEAIEIIEKEQKQNPVLFVKKNWEPGIIGLIAGKLCEYYYKPTFVFTKIDGELVASGRSIPEFNMVESLVEVEKYLKRYGGHSQACGFSLKDENEYNKFIKMFLQIAEAKLKDKDLVPTLDIDAVIKLKDINWKLLDEIKMIEPYGIANSRPLFLIKKLRVSEVRLVGENGKHLRLKLQDSQDNRIINAIGFSLNNKEKEKFWGEKLQTEQLIDVVGFIDVNEWNGNRELQLKIIDLRLGEI